MQFKRAPVYILLLLCLGILVVWFVLIPARLSNLPNSFTRLAAALEDPHAEASFRVLEPNYYSLVDFELEGSARTQVLSLLLKRPQKSIHQTRAYIEDLAYGFLEIKSDAGNVTVLLFPSQFTPELKDCFNSAWRVHCSKLERIIRAEMPDSPGLLIRQNDARFVEAELEGVRTAFQERTAFEQIIARRPRIVIHAYDAGGNFMGVPEEQYWQGIVTVRFSCEGRTIDHKLISPDNIEILMRMGAKDSSEEAEGETGHGRGGEGDD